MSRVATPDSIFHHDALEKHGLNETSLLNSVNHVYSLFDSIDEARSVSGEERLGGLVELAKLSAIIGNVFRSGLVKHSNGVFKENAPHTFPDLLSTRSGTPDLEIKVALEKNKPKGHLVKPGEHLILRYVLGSPNWNYSLGRDRRGKVPYLWEVKLGRLEEHHFSVSNTEGDSGKTAVITEAGMSNLATVYFDARMFPYAANGSVYKRYKESLGLL